MHYKQRIEERLLNPQKLLVGYELPDSIGEYHILGDIILSEATKKSILNKLSIIEGIKFDPLLSYGVKLFQFNLTLNKITFKDEVSANLAVGKNLVLVEPDTESNGDVIYLIIRGGKIVTFYFGKSYVFQDKYKLRVNEVIE